MNHPRQAILVTFIGPTDRNLNPRYRARCEAGSIVRECDDDADPAENAARAAVALCEKLGWDASCLVAGTLFRGKGYVYVSADMGAAPQKPRWTREAGNVLAIDGIPATSLSLERDKHHNAPISPSQHDDIAEDVCAFLNRREISNPTEIRNPNDAESARRDRGLPARDGTTKRSGK